MPTGDITKKIFGTIFMANRRICIPSTKSNKTSALTSTVVEQFWFKNSTTQALKKIKSYKTVVVGAAVFSTLVIFSGEIWFQLSGYLNTHKK
jgi:hypothetical protein